MNDSEKELIVDVYTTHIEYYSELVRPTLVQKSTTEKPAPHVLRYGIKNYLFGLGIGVLLAIRGLRNPRPSDQDRIATEVDLEQLFDMIDELVEEFMGEI